MKHQNTSSVRPESPYERWDVFVEEVVFLAMESSICSAFVYPVITGLSTQCDYTVVLAGAVLSLSHTHTLLLFHLHRHGNSSHRGEPVHRKLGVWQDKPQRSSDTVPWQPARTVENDKKKKSVGKGTCWWDHNGHSGTSTLSHSLDCECSETNQAHSTYFPVTHISIIYLVASVQTGKSFFKTLPGRCAAKAYLTERYGVSTSACADKVLLKQLSQTRERNSETSPATRITINSNMIGR